MQDHPRGCGENKTEKGVELPDAGSPPRMRGKLFAFIGFAVTSRITPADAGKTESLWEQGETRWDHPRGCGENCKFAGIPAHVTGSPPRMRGKPRRRLRNWHFVRITPADAGKTSRRLSGLKNDWDHPRGCGENVSPCGCVPRHRGSPPRMRGKLQAAFERFCGGGITPADAGKTRYIH